jgi:hypothetical protein
VEKRGAAFVHAEREASLHVPLQTMRRASGGGVCGRDQLRFERRAGVKRPARFSPLCSADLARLLLRKT